MEIGLRSIQNNPEILQWPFFLTGSKLKPEDDDSWIDLKPETFDEMLKAHFKLKDEVDQTTKNKSKQEIPSEVKNFLKTMSDFEGKVFLSFC